MPLTFQQRARDLGFYTLRAVFRLVPLSETQRDGLRNWFLDRHLDLIPTAVRGEPPLLAAVDRQARHRADMPAIGYRARQRQPLPSPLPATVVAFYLPQFHPIAENDDWWGEGFTEWRNVAGALPQFEGHNQPRLPGALGFYDLRTPGVMQHQVDLARDYGIGAFCFYFYWFNGKRLLDAPLRHWLANPSLNLPFCLCWANESWSRRWDGRGNDVLIEQNHHAEDDLAFIAHISDYLRDPRYLRVDGKPLLLVYRPGLMPDAKATAARWRDYCRAHGVGELCIAYVQGFERPDPMTLGFDAAVEFPPNMSSLAAITADKQLINPDFVGDVFDWRELASTMQQRPDPAYRLYPGVNPGWDNEPRRASAGRIFQHASPRGYRDWLQNTIQRRLAGVPPSQRLVFVNAWNEWAEGAVLEPDRRLGHAWLDATRQALQRASGRAVPSAENRYCAVIHAWYPDVFDELVAALQATGLCWRLIVTTCEAQAPLIRERLAASDFSSELHVGENRGRDILPFLHVADRLLDEGVDVVLKLHTKRSPHRADGEQWRRDIVDSLVPPEQTTQLRQRFDSDPALGLIGPEAHVKTLAEHLGSNAPALAYLGARLGLQKTPERAGAERFVTGSMFWVRLAALRPILDSHLSAHEFEPEAAQLDGTLAHAIERIFARAAIHAGYSMESTPLPTR